MAKTLTKILSLGLLAVSVSTASFAHSNQEAGGLDGALICAATSDRLQRLQCYDALFQNREVLVEVSTPEPAQPQAPSLPPTSLLNRLKSLEALRPIDHMDWFLRLQPWDTQAYLKPEEFAVIKEQLKGFVTSSFAPRSFDVVASLWPSKTTLQRLDLSEVEPPLLVMACADDLTTMSLYAPSFDSDYQINVTYQLEGHPDRAMRWRSLDYDKVFHAGRGAESRKLIEALRHHRRLQLTVDEGGMEQVLVYDLGQFNPNGGYVLNACDKSLPAIAEEEDQSSDSEGSGSSSGESSGAS